MGITL